MSAEQELERLQDQNPGWQITYAEGKAVPWIAIRERRADWRGGYPVAEALDPEELRVLIEGAVETEAKVHARTVRAQRTEHGERCVR
ncbi:hypothetical protein GCM10022254_10240 [Actinomadura meridiana]|uniref:Uncharacterized protein n=1 Tax=Actinomadura meridiana TaxID=559626 RepID=A0ABP8BTX8_9ACTN